LESARSKEFKMGLTDKVIIEVAVNENAMRTANPNVPYAPDEIAREAQRCHDAGAAIVHYHARDPVTAAMSSDIELNLACQRAVTESTPLLAYPTYGDVVAVTDSWYDLCSPAPTRYAHFVRGVEESIRFEIGPIDLGAFFDINALKLADDADAPPPRTSEGDAMHAALDGCEVPGWLLNPGHQINNGYDHVWLLKFCRKHALHPTFAAPDTSALLSLRNLIDMGLVPEREVSLKLFFWGDRALATRFRGMHDLARELFGDREARLTPVVHQGDGLSLTRHAMSLGCDVRTGLGDDPHATMGDPTNAELVERLVKMARALGREPATPNEVRQLKGIQLPVGNGGRHST
jgi:uncharacterized protein (DUF849 family)